jgi:hypothetical protein
MKSERPNDTLVPHGLLAEVQEAADEEQRAHASSCAKQ